MKDEWKSSFIHEEMVQVIERLMKVWGSVEEGYGPEIVYSIILNVCFQFAAGYQKATKGAVTAEQVLDQLVHNLQNMRPKYITDPPTTSEEEDHTNE